jgi:hypothetical protein
MLLIIKRSGYSLSKTELAWILKNKTKNTNKKTNLLAKKTFITIKKKIIISVQ